MDSHVYLIMGTRNFLSQKFVTACSVHAPSTCTPMIIHTHMYTHTHSHPHTHTHSYAHTLIPPPTHTHTHTHTPTPTHSHTHPLTHPHPPTHTHTLTEAEPSSPVDPSLHQPDTQLLDKLKDVYVESSTNVVTVSTSRQTSAKLVSMCSLDLQW